MIYIFIHNIKLLYVENPNPKPAPYLIILILFLKNIDKAAPYNEPLAIIKKASIM